MIYVSYIRNYRKKAAFIIILTAVWCRCHVTLVNFIKHKKTPSSIVFLSFGLVCLLLSDLHGIFPDRASHHLISPKSNSWLHQISFFYTQKIALKISIPGDKMCSEIEKLSFWSLHSRTRLNVRAVVFSDGYCSVLFVLPEKLRYFSCILCRAFCSNINGPISPHSLRRNRQVNSWGEWLGERFYG